MEGRSGDGVKDWWISRWQGLCFDDGEGGGSSDELAGRKEQACVLEIRCRENHTNMQSGSTPRRPPRSPRPTLVRVCASSSRTATSSSSPPSSTLVPVLVSTPPPSVSVATLVPVSARVPPRPVCLPRLCGSVVCVSSVVCFASTARPARSTSTCELERKQCQSKTGAAK